MAVINPAFLLSEVELKELFATTLSPSIDTDRTVTETSTSE